MIKIIAVTHGHDKEVDVFLNSLILQTSDEWELWLVHDGIPPKSLRDKMVKFNHDRRIHFDWSSQRVGAWGHANRGEWLQKIKATDEDYVLLTNADNYYVPIFIETMLVQSLRNRVGFIYCDTIHSHLGYKYHISTPCEGGIDMGAFIVRADIAKGVGFRWTHFSADGRYAQECADASGDTIHVHMGLFVHN